MRIFLHKTQHFGEAITRLGEAKLSQTSPQIPPM